jgi:hypothetical protein
MSKLDPLGKNNVQPHEHIERVRILPKESEADMRTVPQSRKITPFKGAVRIVGFFFLVAIVAVVTDWVINRGLRRIQTSKFGALNSVISGRVDADIVISGSSRALNHYDPRVIQSITGRSAYNIGMNASQIDFQLAVLKTYLKHNTPPRLVIQNLDLFSFETTRKGEIYEPGNYLPFLSDDELYAGLRRIDPNVWKWKYIPLYGYAVEDMRFTWIWGILGFFGMNPSEDYFQGFNPRRQVWTGDFERFRQEHPEGVRYAVEPLGVQNLTEICEICRDRGIALLLVYSPEYVQMQSMEVNRGEIFAQFRAICDRLQIPLWDYSDSAISMDKINFYNSQHLNAIGAQSFSEDLSGRMVRERLIETNSQPKSGK